MEKMVGEVKMQIEEENEEKTLEDKVEEKCRLGLWHRVLSNSWWKEVWK